MKFPPTQLKQVAQLNLRTLSENTDPDFEFDYIDIGSVSAGKGVTSTKRLCFRDAPSRARRIVRTGDVIISTVRTYLKAMAYIGPEYDGAVVSTGFAVLTPDAKCNHRFLSYALESDDFLDRVIQESTGVSYPAINPEALARLRIPLPQLAIQKPIANFLDRETARIDTLIEKKREIQLSLACKFETEINKQIPGPRQCEGVPLKYVATTNDDTLSENTNPATLLRYAAISDVSQVGNVAARNVTFCDAPSRARRKVQERDVILSTVGYDRRSVALITPDECETIFSTGFMVIRPKYLLSEFLFFTILSSWFQKELNSITAGVSIPAFTPGAAGRIRINNQPKDQQFAATTRLNKLYRNIFATKTKIDESIDRLKEYRASLITAAVTGQIDVATWTRGAEGEARSAPDLEEAIA